MKQKTYVPVNHWNRALVAFALASFLHQAPSQELRAFILTACFVLMIYSIGRLSAVFWLKIFREFNNPVIAMLSVAILLPIIICVKFPDFAEKLYTAISLIAAGLLLYFLHKRPSRPKPSG